MERERERINTHRTTEIFFFNYCNVIFFAIGAAINAAIMMNNLFSNKKVNISSQK